MEDQNKREDNKNILKDVAKIKKEIDSEIKHEVLEKMFSLIIASFGLVAALAWNEAIMDIFKKIFGTTEGIIPTLTYAIVVTVIAVIATIWIGKVSSRIKRS